MPVLSIRSIQQQLLEGQLTVLDLVNNYLSNIEATRHLNIYVEVFRAEALEKAKALDRRMASPDFKPGRLFGVVISIKDVLCYEGHQSTAASKMLEGYTSPYTSTAVKRALDEDAIIIGRTNCDEFAMGSTNEHSHYGPTLNGLSPDRVPGGSSGGAAVSVQQNTCGIALGSDTGGSVRQPAAYCGVIGLKPSYGRISRYGLIAYASSFDQIGIIGHDLDDIYQVLAVIEGADPFDTTCADVSPSSDPESLPEEQWTFGYLSEVLDHPRLKPGIKESVRDLMELMSDAGYKVSGTSFSLLDYMIPAYYVLTTAEASSNLSRYDGIRYGYRHSGAQGIDDLIIKSRSEGFGTEVKRRIMMGTFVLSVGYFDAYFLKAQKIRRLIQERMDDIFKTCDFLLMPTAPDIAPLLGEAIANPVEMYLSDIFTVLANLCGYPAISIPLKHPGTVLPYGVQLIGQSFDESRLLKAAALLQNMA